MAGSLKFFFGKGKPKFDKKKLASGLKKEQKLIRQQQQKPSVKARLGKLLWKIAAVLVIVGVIGAVFLSRPDNSAQKAVEETRRALRQQGFKTDLADFDFSTSSELRAREAALTAIASSRFSEPFHDHPNLMEVMGNDSAVVVWKQDSLKRQFNSWPNNSDQLTWDEFRDAVNENQPALDAACEAALSGPIRFDLNARDGDAMRLPHLALMKNLILTLCSRTVLDLHDGNKDAAWTNLLASTRLVAAWETEPVEISQLVRFGNTSLTYNAIWQALQTNGWSDEQLARLQQEWEPVDFFTNLPETVAFKRASAVATCQRERQEHLSPGIPFTDLIKEMFRSPRSGWAGLVHQWSQLRYRGYGTYMDEKALLLFFRDRELELRNAIQAATWAQMRQLPGVTNKIFFQSKYRSRLQSMMNLREIGTVFQRQGTSLLGRAAEAEARRQIIITAIALERYRGKHGSYPNALSALAPEFLKTAPLDFMDGQPLRYRLTDDGHFLLYSVGLDCVDDGGIMPLHEWETRLPGGATLFAAPPQADLVWPLPASMADVQALRQQQERAIELRNLNQQERESEEEWNQSPLRQARVAKILATKWSPDTSGMSDGGQPVSENIRNTNVTGTNQLSLTDLLAPRQITIGDEPENLTFEVPVSYDFITNRGGLTLMVDADPDNPESTDSGARIQDCNRATNGDSLLVWHTIFDPPGPHAVQVELTWVNQKGGFFIGKGPAISVVTSNLCQFSLDSANYDVDRGATFHARLPEANGLYTIECVTTNGEHLKTLTGSTTNGEFKTIWNLVDDHGHRLHGETFNSIVHVTLPDSGRSQTLKGP